MTATTGVSFVVPVHNGARYLERVLDAILAQADGRPMEVLAIEDGSRDGSAAILARYAASGHLTILDGRRRGAAAALNQGLTHASHPVICQVDQDVILRPGWMRHLTAALADDRIGAAQGYYETPDDTSIWSRVMGRDLEDRYQRLPGDAVDHVCTGNTAYRAEALRSIGGFDESLGYGYDNDVSYRLSDAGYRLVIRPEARSVHYWRDGWWSYMVQQYGFGYGRLDLVAKHRHRLTGDDVSRLPMMLHGPLMGAVLVLLAAAVLLAAFGASPRWPLVAAAATLAALIVDRLIAGVRATRRFRDPVGLWFVPMHLLRDLAWVAAITMWCGRRLRGGSSRPADSMRPRAVTRTAANRSKP